MSLFKSRETGDIVTAFGPVHDHYASRPDYELVEDDRNGMRDTTPQPEVLDDPEDAKDTEPLDSQDPAPADKVGKNSRSTK